MWMVLYRRRWVWVCMAVGVVMAALALISLLRADASWPDPERTPESQCPNLIRCRIQNPDHPTSPGTSKIATTYQADLRCESPCSTGNGLTSEVVGTETLTLVKVPKGLSITEDLPLDDLELAGWTVDGVLGDSLVLTRDFRAELPTRRKFWPITHWKMPLASELFGPNLPSKIIKRERYQHMPPEVRKQENRYGLEVELARPGTADVEITYDRLAIASTTPSSEPADSGAVQQRSIDVSKGLDDDETLGMDLVSPWARAHEAAVAVFTWRGWPLFFGILGLIAAALGAMKLNWRILLTRHRKTESPDGEDPDPADEPPLSLAGPASPDVDAHASENRGSQSASADGPGPLQAPSHATSDALLANGSRFHRRGGCGVAKWGRPMREIRWQEAENAWNFSVRRLLARRLFLQ